MLKFLHRMLLVLLIASIVGMGVTAIVRSQQALERGDRVLREADEFLRRWRD